MAFWVVVSPERSRARWHARDVRPWPRWCCRPRDCSSPYHEAKDVAPHADVGSLHLRRLPSRGVRRPPARPPVRRLKFGRCSKGRPRRDRSGIIQPVFPITDIPIGGEPNPQTFGLASRLFPWSFQQLCALAPCLLPRQITVDRVQRMGSESTSCARRRETPCSC